MATFVAPEPLDGFLAVLGSPWAGDYWPETPSSDTTSAWIQYPGGNGGVRGDGSSTLRPQYGPGTLYPFGFTILELVKLVYRIRAWTWQVIYDDNPDTTQTNTALVTKYDDSFDLSGTNPPGLSSENGILLGAGLCEAFQGLLALLRADFLAKYPLSGSNGTSYGMPTILRGTDELFYPFFVLTAPSTGYSFSYQDMNADGTSTAQTTDIALSRAGLVFTGQWTHTDSGGTHTATITLTPQTYWTYNGKYDADTGELT